MALLEKDKEKADRAEPRFSDAQSEAVVTGWSVPVMESGWTWQNTRKRWLG